MAINNDSLIICALLKYILKEIVKLPTLRFIEIIGMIEITDSLVMSGLTQYNINEFITI